MRKWLSIPSNKDGFDRLIKSIPGEPVFSIENTGPYSGNLVHFLDQKQYKIIKANPYDVSRLREAFSQSVKNDDIDAYVLAQAARMNVLKHSSKGFEYIYLQDILERYFDLKERRTAIINQLRSNLAETFLEITKVFRKINSNVVLAILEMFPSAFASANMEEVIDRIRQNNGRTTMKRLLELKRLCLESIAWKQSSFHERIIQSQVRELKAIEKEVSVAEKLLGDFVADTFAKEVELLQSVPGIGKITAAHTLAILGDTKRFDANGDGKGAKRVSSFVGFGEENIVRDQDPPKGGSPSEATASCEDCCSWLHSVPSVPMPVLQIILRKRNNGVVVKKQ